MTSKLKTVTIPKGIPGTITLLQKGVRIHAIEGMSIREFMTEAIGLSADYAEKRVRAIFVNSSPVDDIDGVKIKDQDIISLSGALPGICGIAMSRDTVISGFRSDISARTSDAVRQGNAIITVKLFNLVASESGALLLEKGVIVDSVDVLEALKENSPSEINSKSGSILLKI
ncbi:hypothetical protein [Maridesulfovibrio zosterae]|uniref:hypothetical protein n=1 Tax=Maridesulfovibrio zosterae TaxID=82171 RepID=UPI0003FF8DA4|nr:hypothetical protein [Maridesulfovibrio zosterae]